MLSDPAEHDVASNDLAEELLSSLVRRRRQRGPVARHDDLPVRRTDGAEMG